MYLVFWFVKIFPMIALGMIWMFVELGIFFRRKQDKKQHLFWVGIVVFSILTGVWIGFRGDKHSDEWVKAFFILD